MCAYDGAARTDGFEVVLRDTQMLTAGMVVLGMVTFLAMVGFVALCDRV
jgi:hypothetical protein